MQHLEEAFQKEESLRFMAQNQVERYSSERSLHIQHMFPPILIQILSRSDTPTIPLQTTLALHAIAESQKQGGTAAFVDAEHALDPAYSADLGVDVDDLLVSQPDCGESKFGVTTYYGTREYAAFTVL